MIVERTCHVCANAILHRSQKRQNRGTRAVFFIIMPIKRAAHRRYHATPQKDSTLPRADRLRLANCATGLLMGKPEEAELLPARSSRAPMCNVSSRDIDEAHRPRITRRTAAVSMSAGRTSTLHTFLPRAFLGAAALAGAVMGASLCLWLVVPGAPQEQASPAAPLPPDASIVADRMPLDDGGHAALPADDGKQPERGAAIVAPSASGAPSPALAQGTAAGKENVGQTRSAVINAPRAPPHGAAPRQAARHPRVLVQLSAYSDYAKARAAADRFEKSLRGHLGTAAIGTARASVRGKIVWRVVAGPVTSRQRGERLCRSLRSAGQACIVILL
jgi:hypothetical protein